VPPSCPLCKDTGIRPDPTQDDPTLGTFCQCPIGTRAWNMVVDKIASIEGDAFLVKKEQV